MENRGTALALVKRRFADEGQETLAIKACAALPLTAAPFVNEENKLSLGKYAL